MRRLPTLLALLCIIAFPARSAPTLLAVDEDTGAVLYQQDATQPRHPASLTKMMTVYVAFAAIRAGQADFDQRVTVSPGAAAEGGSVLGLKAGTTLTLRDALLAVVVRSANDAAVAVAEHLAGSEEAFALRMTETARRLGMSATTFRNATGLTVEGHVTTARDIALLGLALRRDFPDLYPLFSRRAMAWRGGSLPSVNAFLAQPGAEGLKTGFTCPAGYNLVAAARRNGRAVLAVVMGAPSRDERLRLAADLVNRAVAGKLSPSGSLAALTVAAGLPPDYTAIACPGGRSGGGPAVIEAVMPSGWAIDLGLAATPAQAAAKARAVQAKRPALRRGTVVTLAKAAGGVVRWRALVAGLDQQAAVPTCLAIRTEADTACLVLSPAMAAGAADEARRLKRASARD
ncbi:MAG TPA: D-alanyl-D-alanine carboxypeptidase family protein [Candidatus Omnitrophota bacterium]|nr:D-alanyl-D-alanine carboxypeptidase family protein [Candidatus Omnitrophota bacterium]